MSDLEKDLEGLRLMHLEVDTARAAATERSAALAKAIESKDAAFQRVEQRIEALEAKIAERDKTIRGERELFEEKIAKLKEQLEAESAALRSRKARCSQPGGNVGLGCRTATLARQDPAFEGETACEKVARLRG